MSVTVCLFCLLVFAAGDGGFCFGLMQARRHLLWCGKSCPGGRSLTIPTMLSPRPHRWRNGCSGPLSRGVLHCPLRSLLLPHLWSLGEQ